MSNLKATIAKIKTSTVVADEPDRNKFLMQQLQASELFRDFIIVDNKKGVAPFNCCRYQLSKEDFGIHRKQHEAEGEVVAVTVMYGEDLENLDVGSGDCKISARDSDRRQLLANMLKSGSDGAYK